MSKGDKIIIKTPNGDESIEATTNGAKVSWSLEKDSGVQWVVAVETSKADKAVRTMKFKQDYVLGIVDVPSKPV